MPGASDKARFYLEQYVPELQEYERKEIFLPEEIKAITSKRSDFEHTINARGCKPGDYARYATYEMNLDSLRKKRCIRLGVKSTVFSGQRTIFFILDRATKRFQGDMGLWMLYINFCQREKANKKLAKVLTNVLRLKPREWGLWVLAAKHYAEAQGDMTTARSYMQRGLRFCKDERKLWLEYMRLEMVYLAKLAARRKILGLDEDKKEVQPQEAEADESMDIVPVLDATDVEPDAQRGIDEVDDEALKKLAAAPALTGAIPLAIFDAATKQFGHDASFTEDAFDLCVTFEKVPSTPRILQHILEDLQSHAPRSIELVICQSKMILFDIAMDAETFPPALGSSLATIKKTQPELASPDRPRLAEKAVLMLLPYLRARDEVDEDIKTVLEASVKRFLKLMSHEGSLSSRMKTKDAVTNLVDMLRKGERGRDAELVQEYRQPLEAR